MALKIIITEGEKKCLALESLAWHGRSDAADGPRWLPMAVSGVWSWRGKTGRVQDPSGGGWLRVTGPLPEFDSIAWQGRQIVILFDSNVSTNEDVARARSAFGKELCDRGAVVSFVDIPADAGVNGVDDLLGAWGKDRVIALIETGAYDPQAESKSQAPILSEIGNAERFANMYRGEALYCHSLKSWFVWDQTRFAPDEDAKVERFAKKIVRQLCHDALALDDKDTREATIKFALRSESDHGIRSLLNRAAAEDGIPIRVNDLDTDGWLLNVQNGTINLHTGKLGPHNPQELISKLAPVGFDPTASCPRWLQFLKEIFEPHPDLLDFVQKAVGYSITGDVREECLFILNGTGRNGKGTFIGTLQAMLGDYGSTADFSTFISARDDRGPRDDVANMRGRRLVVSQEVREGAPLAEALIKWLTGGDLVRARNLYERSVEWRPTHHLWLAVNRKPIIHGTDTGIWSRIRLVPFSVSFDGCEDKTLKAKLLDELPGILAWAVEGCLLWQRDGLGTCKSVQSATSEYRAESDQLARFIEECCMTGPYVSAKARALYERYRRWADQSGEEIATETSFGLNLRERGFEKKHTSAGKTYSGIGLQLQSDG
ncbi:MAG TPA: phage/plasmid primase, P4 family [Candidatus Saccharimonadales bacterium]|nr:phage/plasmid primase, P4 family [Candidatus Saccharimonadales bacterium]